MKAHEVIVLRRYGWIPEFLLINWSASQNMNPIRDASRRLFLSFMFGVGGISLISFWFSLGLPLQAESLGLVALAPILLAVSLGLYCFECAFGKDLRRLRKILDVKWRTLASADQSYFIKQASTVLQYRGARMKRAEKKFDTGSPEAEAAFRNFDGAYRLLRTFGLAGDRRDEYLKNWEAAEVPIYDDLTPEMAPSNG